MTKLKQSKRHSASDEKDIQEMLDLASKIIEIALRQGAMKASQPMVVKQADGSWRWFGFSSSSFRDKDREIVTQRALESDVAYADETKEYGDFRWWHTPIVIGTCDFNAMHGKVLIESGIVASEKVALAMKEHADELGLSIAFRHPLDQPHVDGTFTHIRRYERSLLPKRSMSNLLASIPLVTKENTMLQEKLDALSKLLGGDETTVKAMLAAAEDKQKAAEKAGLASKEEKPAEGTPAPDEGAAAAEEKKEPTTLAALTVEEFVAILAEAIKPLMAGATAMASKETQLGDTLKQVTEQNGQVLGALRLTAEAVKAQNDSVANAIKRLETLESDLPALVAKGYRASADPNTITTKEGTPAPSADPLSALVDALDGKTKPAA